jgi:signal transduction histidine kinase
MKLTLRRRIILTLLPLLAILAVLGGAGIALLFHLGRRADVILRENYDSVLYMERLGEALERIDSAFAFAMLGREQLARKQYAENWEQFDDNLRKEQGNITIPGEGDLVAKLTAQRNVYKRQGDAFFACGPAVVAVRSVGLLTAGERAFAAAALLLPARGTSREDAYFGREGQPGLLASFKQTKETSGDILRLNQDNMEHASREARATATASVVWFAAGLAVAAGLAGLLAVRTVRDILRPIRAVTESALAIGGGNLHQVVPVVAGDELGQLATAFNLMARQLRNYRHSQQARLLRLQQTSQATVNAFPHPVLVVDSQGCVVLANPAACLLLGVPAGGTEPPTPESARPADRSAALCPWQPPEPLRTPLADALREQRDYLPEGFDRTFPLRLGGEERSFLPRVLTIRDPHDETLGAAVVLEDVTRFRLLDQVKSNLVATVSHELKTPLTGIRLAVHLLLEEEIGPLTPKQLELLLDARDNTERLLLMIENLLDLARLESKGPVLDVRPEPPGELLRQAAEVVRPRAEDKGVKLTVETPPDLPAVAADADRVSHALHNLLDNALRYTQPGGRVALTAAVEDGKVTLTVADNGSGIPAEYLPRVFDRFFRVPGQSQEGGTGLGLAIVREIVAAHGGTVTCESRTGEGTTFRMTLPVWNDDKGTRGGGDQVTRR